MLHLQSCAGSISSASKDELRQRPGFFGLLGVRLLGVRGGAGSMESLWTILFCVAFGFRARVPDCPRLPHSPLSPTFVKADDGNAISWLRYRKYWGLARISPLAN